MATSPAPLTEADVLARGKEILSERLPEGWEVRAVTSSRDRGTDGIVDLRSPDGALRRLVFEVKRTVESRDVQAIHDQITRYASDVTGSPEVTGVVAARYLSPPVRQKLIEAGLSFVDATGNVRITSPAPGLFVSDRGADRDPWRGPGRPRGSLKGAPAAQVVRALLDYDRRWPIRALVETSGASTGAAYRVVQFLEEEGLVERHASQVVVPEWQPLLRRWSRDYELVASNRTTTWLAPRGLDRFLSRVAESDAEYAVTGTLAAAEWSPYAPARSAMIYTPDVARASATWDLRPVETSANVVLAEPLSTAVFARTRVRTDGGYQIAAPAQVAVDLLTGPGRNPSEGEELIEWMARNERTWRQQD
ncbi:helix-turn-helix domain-containing protein [Kribbella sp. CA-245084]|uniref:helix-turn-helix domain-containing protein n=1 Tax=Kribbella sp. CA-245084 TaxID=3239940 RepID=UPI003D9498A8